MWSTVFYDRRDKKIIIYNFRYVVRIMRQVRRVYILLGRTPEKIYIYIRFIRIYNDTTKKKNYF